MLGSLWSGTGLDGGGSGSRRLRSRLSLCRSLGGSANGGFADEDRTCFDGERLGFDIADDFGAGLEFNAVGGGEVAMNLAINDDGGGFDFRFDAGVFTDGQIPVGGNFAFDFAIHD